MMKSKTQKYNEAVERNLRSIGKDQARTRRYQSMPIEKAYRAVGIRKDDWASQHELAVKLSRASSNPADQREQRQ